MIELLPGTKLAAIARFLCSTRSYERVYEPIIADTQYEYTEAIKKPSRSHQRGRQVSRKVGSDSRVLDLVENDTTVDGSQFLAQGGCFGKAAKKNTVPTVPLSHLPLHVRLCPKVCLKGAFTASLRLSTPPCDLNDYSSFQRLRRVA